MLKAFDYVGNKEVIGSWSVIIAVSSIDNLFTFRHFATMFKQMREWKWLTSIIMFYFFYLLYVCCQKRFAVMLIYLNKYGFFILIQN